MKIQDCFANGNALKYTWHLPNVHFLLKGIRCNEISLQKMLNECIVSQMQNLLSKQLYDRA